MAARKLSDEDLVEIQRLRTAGTPSAEIAEQFGISKTTVEKRSKSPNPRPGSGRKLVAFAASDAETAEMYRLWVGGMTQPKIAERYGCSNVNVSQRLRRYTASLPVAPRETVLRRELDVLDGLRETMLAIVHNEGGRYSATDRLTAARGVITSMERLAKMLGLDASDLLSERRVALAEKQAEMVAQAMGIFAQAMGHDPATERVRTAMRSALEVVQVDRDEEDVA